MSQIKASSGMGRLGYLIAGATLVAMPLTAVFGCGNAEKEAELYYMYDQQSNGRTAYLKTDGGFNGANAETGTVSSNLSADDTEASFDFDTKDGEGQIDGFAQRKTGPHTDPTFAEFGPTTLYGNAGGRRIEVTPLGDVDDDGNSDDAFLMFTHDAQGKEFSMSYGGTRTTLKDIDDVRKKGDAHTATYRGKGEFYTAIGTDVFRHRGKLEMKATFAGDKAGIEGEINQLRQTNVGGAPVPAPVAFDKLKFTGKFDKEVSPDYETTDWAHFNGTNQVTKLTSKGVGSFFGAKAGGTVGVFSGTGSVIHGGSKVNLLGAYHGTTGENR
ncbi:MAG: hypothetical protein KF723_20785 [Rhizobiaceae bacterium]|nr:hypothetical protein [Rhizobiaceae bacterium]